MRFTEAKRSNGESIYTRRSEEESEMGLPQEELREMKKQTSTWLRCRCEITFPTDSFLTIVVPFYPRIHFSTVSVTHGRLWLENIK